MNEENKVQIYIVEHDINSVCRICGTASENQLLPIFGNDIDVDLADKIEMYLPVKICEDDILPTKVCSSCADRIFSWDSLYQCCLNADKHFKTILSEEQLTEDRGESIGDIKYDDTDEDEEANQDQQYDEVHLDNYSDDNDEMHIEVDDDVVHVDDDDDDRLEEYSENIIDDNDENDDDFKVEEHHENIKPEDIDKNEVILHEDDIPNVQPYQEAEDIEKDEQIKVNEAKTENQFEANTTKHKGSCNINEENTTLDLEVVKIEDQIEFESYLLLKKRTTCIMDGKFVCPDCHKEFNNEEEFCTHLVEKHDHKGGWLATISRKTFKTEAISIERSVMEINGEVFYKCEECKKIMPKLQSFKNHIRIHTGEKPYECIFCGKKFRIYQGILRHVQTVHLQLKKYTCDICHNKFTSAANLREHKNLHTNERPHVCDLCGKSFRQKASLFLHKKTHETTFAHHCPQCNKGFRTKLPMRLHLAVHTGEKPHECDICHKTFRIKHDLNSHKSIHKNDKPFKCKQCQVDFKLRRYLTRHNKIHHGQIKKL